MEGTYHCLTGFTETEHRELPIHYIVMPMLSLTDDRFDVLTEIDLEADLKNNISIKTKINHWTIF